MIGNNSFRERRAISQDRNSYFKNGDSFNVNNPNNISLNNYNQKDNFGNNLNQNIKNYSSNNEYYMNNFENSHNNSRLNSTNYANKSGQNGSFMNSSQGGQRKKKEPVKTSFQPTSSLAEENLVKNFNKLNPKNRINEEYLQTNKPQRIELPLFFNTPIRFNDNQLNTKIKSRSLIQKNYNTIGNIPESQQMGITKLNYSFNQFSQFNMDQSSFAKNPLESEEVQKQTIAEKHIYLRSLRRRKDYEMLAFACKRAGKPRDEGRSYYSIGVLNDNIGKYKVAIKSYEKFLQICQNIGDQHGEALAYNCLGVDFQMLGQQEKDNQFYEKAIQYHKQHENIADVNGKFLACINLGLCYDAINLRKQALSYYQQALRHSVKMSNLASQTIAIGNIGRIGMPGLLDNKEKMTVFIDKYIKLTQDMKDENGELKAQLKMGQVTSMIGNFEQGKQSFLRALQLAEQKQELDKLQEAKCGFAVANAEIQMQSYLQSYAQKMQSIQEQNELDQEQRQNTDGSYHGFSYK
ncbi:hypothetical protein ABPG74_002313 [Tetrahymena malaccensis]